MSELIKRLFCKHEKEICREYRKSEFVVISGEIRVIRCKKCGKIFKRWFKVYE